jgi:hypothetical protein
MLLPVGAYRWTEIKYKVSKGSKIWICDVENVHMAKYW